MRLFVFAFVWLMFAPICVSAQMYRFKSYTSSMGLPSSAVYHLYQDRKGYMWFGTGSGVCRYDGAVFTTLSVREGLADASVRSVFEDRRGRLWLATQGGVTLLDGAKTTNYTTADGLSGNEVYCGLARDDGSAWFGTAQGVDRFDGRRFEPVGKGKIPAGRIWTMIQDRTGIVWAGLRGGGLVRIEVSPPGAAEPFAVTAYGKRDGLPDENVFGLAEDPRGGIWLATTGGLCFFDFKSFRSYTKADGLPVEMTNGVLVDRHGRVWCSTFGGGLCRLEADGRFTVFNRSNGLPNDTLTGVYRDEEGNIWCTTLMYGVFRFSGEQFASYGGPTGLIQGMVTGIAEAADGTLWLTSLDDGLAALSPDGRVRHWRAGDGLLENSLWCLCLDRAGNIWVGGYQGVSRFDGRAFRHFTREQIGARDRITAISEDPQGRMWFGSHPSTSNGVFVLKDGKFTRYSTEQGLAGNQVSGFLFDRAGRTWLCTEGGLSRLDGNGFTSWRVEDGLPSKRVRVGYEDAQGMLWIGTTDGLSRFDGRTFQSYKTEDGLSNDLIRSIVEYDGKLWVGTARGISVFDGKKFSTYTAKDGLMNEEIYTAACVKRRDGSLWFGTSDGAVRYLPAKDITLRLPPRVNLTGIRVSGGSGPVVTPAANDPNLRVPPLSYDQNGVTFEFVGLSYVDESSVHYRYRLDGFDSEWSEPSPIRSARYTNLPPGTYRFLVRACSAAGLWSEPQAVEVTIQPPFWRTWWFQVSAMFIAGGLLYGFYAWRIRTLHERQQRRLDHLKQLQDQRLAAMHQLFAGIRVINSQLDPTGVLQNIASESARLVDGEPGGIGLVEDGWVVFRHQWTAQGWAPCSIGFRVGEGVAGRVAETKKSIIVNDAGDSAEVVFPELLEKYGVHGLLDVPISTRDGRVVAVLDIRRPAGRAPFGETDVKLVESLADQATVAIENAGLYGKLEEQNLLIAESLNEIERLYKQEQEVVRTLQDLDRMKTNFLIVTSHEIRTPLTVLKGYHEALTGEFLGPLAPGQMKSLQTCRRMVDRMTTTFNDILEMLKINTGHVSLRKSEFDAETMIRDVLREFEVFIAERKLNIDLEVAAAVTLWGDPGKIRLVAANVIQNAVKFTPDGGSIRIVVASGDDQARITVADSGVGIEPSEIERIFDTFYTTTDPSTHKSGRFEFATRGAGLGLSIAKSYTEAHGGRIWAESDGQGRGSRFHVLLPTAKKNQIDGEKTETSEVTV